MIPSDKSKQLVGIGVDSVLWERMKRFLADHPFLSLERLLAPSEQEIFRTTSYHLQFFSRCIAAKEAYFKALDAPWMAGEAGFSQIEVIQEGGDRFRIRQDFFETDGKFFDSQDGIRARVLVWKKRAE